MLSRIKRTILGEKCQHCSQKIDDPLYAVVKIPGYVGKHEKAFCNEEHLKEYRKGIEKWEEKYGKIPGEQKGPICNC